VERGGGQDPAPPAGGAAGEEVGEHRSDYGAGVQDPGSHGQAVPGKVTSIIGRYHNHLDSAIVSTEWTQEEEEMLFELHEKIGNKWSAISQKIPGRYCYRQLRSDNCVKNHFYSKLRKAVRKLNKVIHDLYSFDFRIIKNCMLSKIIEVTESKFKTNAKEDEEFVCLCNSTFLAMKA
jgi:hypothetical protein